MILAVASGKGGTGKTSISVNLAKVLGFPVQLLDCDVEEPNAHLFFRGALIGEEEINIAVPQINATACNTCDECVNFCQFNALASFCSTPLVFPELCHGCGGCTLVCPRDAISETDFRIGVIRTFVDQNITLKSGCLDVGVSLASALVHSVKARREDGVTAILDAPPGTACPAVATLRGVDYVLLVTEPTPFGLHDLKLAVDTVRELRLPFGVVINRVGIGDDRVHRFCEEENIPVLLEIPDDRRIAEAYSRGELIVEVLPEYRGYFERLWQAITREAGPRSFAMKELIVISGKGGTGKTSITASFAMLAERPVVADCDVDAADLHLVLVPTLRERYVFMSGHQAIIMKEVCCNCGVCLPECRFDAIQPPAPEDGHGTYWIDPTACEGCGVCLETCPMDVIDFPERRCGEWMISDTACGPMVHARLGVAAENSGKLVTTVRQQARRIAEEGHHPIIIVDGPPGIGCPVIASITGASHVLIVTEPSVSGEHDMDRVLDLTRHFSIQTSVCVNKWDINVDMTERIEELARQAGARVVGRIRYDPSVSMAQIQEKAVVETACPCAKDIRQVWKELALQLVE